MNEIVIMSFTEKGKQLADAMADSILAVDSSAKVSASRIKNLADKMKNAFKTGNILIFIGAAGIAVRGIAPLINSKTTDPAVIVVDEAARFVVPILSGHLGGANHWAKNIADMIGATLVLTTATDVNNVFSVDAFAYEKGYSITNPQIIKTIATALLENQEIGLYSDFKIEGDLPQNICLVSKNDSIDNSEMRNPQAMLAAGYRSIDGDLPEDIGKSLLLTQDSKYKKGICISSDIDKKPFETTLNLVPKRYHIGMGSRKNVDIKQTDEFFAQTLESLSVPIQAIASISSIDLKKDEEAIKAISEKYRIQYITYGADELKEVQHNFVQSDFVAKTTGTGNVCETAAYLSSKKGEILLPKTAKNGVTIAIACELWRVSF